MAEKKFNKVEDFLKQGFDSYGKFVARHSVPVLVVSILVSGLLAIGMIRFNKESDVETLYTPQGSQAHQDRDLIENQFTSNTSENFVEYQLTRPPLGVDVIFSDTDTFQKSDSMDVIQRLAEAVRNVTIQSNGNNLKYENICAKSGESCVVVGEFATMAEFWEAYQNQTLTYPIHIDKSGKVHDIQRFLGKPEISNSIVTRTEAIRIFFHLAQDDQSQVAVAKQWEDTVLKVLKDWPDSRINIAFQTSQSMNQEIDQSTSGDIFLISLTFTVMITYACTVTTLLYRNPAMSILATVGIVAVGLAIIAAFGLVSACGLAFVNVVGVAPFLAIGGHFNSVL